MSGSLKDIVKYRIERAYETLKEAELMFDAGHLNGSANRLYYACFYAVNALLLNNDLSSSKHSGVMALFNKNFIKNKLLPVEYGKFYSRMFDARMHSDYADMIVRPEMTQDDIDMAKEFIDYIEKMLSDI